MTVIELAIRYRLIDGLSASIVIGGNLEQMNAAIAHEGNEDGDNQGVTLTLIHERFIGDVAGYDFLDTFTLPLTVHTGESLIVIARYKGCIIGSLVNEVDTSDSSRLLLHPKGGYNVIIYQKRKLEAVVAPDTAVPASVGIYS